MFLGARPPRLVSPPYHFSEYIRAMVLWYITRQYDPISHLITLHEPHLRLDDLLSRQPEVWIFMIIQREPFYPQCTGCKINFLKCLPNIRLKFSLYCIVASWYFSFDRKSWNDWQGFLLFQFVSILKSIRRTITETFTQFKVFQKSKHLQSFICFKKRISYLKTNYSVFRKMQTNFAFRDRKH